MEDSSERALRAALRRGAPLTLSTDELRPRRALEILAEDDGTHRLTVRGETTEVVLELGHGLVVGATARRDGQPLEGREAYALLRRMRGGDLRVEPLRFAGLANVLEPVAALSDLVAPSSAPPAPGPDTIELTIPEARPIHPPPASEPATLELELPSDLVPLAVVPPPPPASAAPPCPAVASAPAEAAAPPPPSAGGCGVDEGRAAAPDPRSSADRFADPPGTPNRNPSGARDGGSSPTARSSGTVEVAPGPLASAVRSGVPPQARRWWALAAAGLLAVAGAAGALGMARDEPEAPTDAAPETAARRPA
ncbi:MAG TPA: hypothetical protein RMH99_27710, partial [Sandaracinaceae bacterium LLY-WYZ-13_1]|nr:hypothetical protein [Sandaracinaceae bacterium LLY-WYZ-13_1]